MYDKIHYMEVIENNQEEKKDSAKIATILSKYICASVGIPKRRRKISKIHREKTTISIYILNIHEYCLPC